MVGYFLVNKMKKIFPLFFLLLTGCQSVNQLPPIEFKSQANAPTATASVSEITRLTNDSAPELLPRVSPDGKSVVVTVRDLTKTGTESLSIVSINLFNPGRRLIAGPFATAGSWVDNSTIVYSYLRGRNPVLVKQALDSAGMKFVSPSAFGERDQLANFSSVSQRFVFQTLVGGVSHVATTDIDGKGFTVYIEGEYPRWLPDGRTIIFQKPVGSYYQLFSFSTRDGSVTQITSGQFNSKFAAPSPSGRQIAFISDRDGNDHIYTMRTDGSALNQLTSGETQEAFPEWLGDNQILFSSDAGAPRKTSGSPYFWPYANIWRINFN